MKKLKPLSLLLLLFVMQHGMSQKSTGHVTLLKKNETAKADGHVTLLKKNEAAKVDGHVTLLKRSAAMIYIGGSGSFPLGKDRGLSFLKNTAGINADVYVPILKKSIISLGLNASSDWNFSNNLALTNTPSPFSIVGENSTSVTATSSSGLKQQNFKFGGGPQLNIHVIEKFIVSPILQLGYMSIAQKNYTATQNSIVTFAGSTDPYSYTLLNISESTSNGLAVIPKLRLHYFFTDWLGLWIEGNYTYGPTVKTTVSTFTPDNVPDVNGQYQLAQMIEGKVTTEVREKRYQSVGVSGGLVFSIGSSKPNPERSIQPNGQEDGNPYPPKTSIKKEKEKIVQEEPKPEQVTAAKTDEAPVETEVINTEKAEPKSTPCTSILSPINGGDYDLKKPIPIKIISDKGFEGSIKLYKTGGNAFTSKLMFGGTEPNQNTIFEKQSQANGFEPINIKANKNDKVYEQHIGEGKLTEGNYSLVVSNKGCPNIIHNLSVSGCVPTLKMNFTNIVCKSFDTVKVSGNIVVSGVGVPFPQISNLRIFSVEEVDALGNSFSPVVTYPFSVLPVNSFPNANGTFPFTLNVIGANCKKVKVNYVFDKTCSSGATPNIYYCDSFIQLPCCICNVCKTDIQLITPPSATASIVGNSISITQPIVTQFNSSLYTIVEAKAEIIGFEKLVDDVCMSCNTNSTLWGNFRFATISIGGAPPKNGVSGVANNNGVVGSTNHSRYWTLATAANNPNSIFRLSVFIPPNSGLSCCCEKITTTIRYTYTFKDKLTGECKTCSTVIKYKPAPLGTCSPVVPNNPLHIIGK